MSLSANMRDKRRHAGEQYWTLIGTREHDVLVQLATKQTLIHCDVIVVEQIPTEKSNL